MKPLLETEITEALSKMSTWQKEGDSLVAKLVFADFVRAFEFLSAVALEAEKQQHHPEIKNVYNRIELRLSTHDAGNKITQKDVDLAQAISDLIKE